jgi:hypothetical protein
MYTLSFQVVYSEAAVQLTQFSVSVSCGLYNRAYYTPRVVCTAVKQQAQYHQEHSLVFTIHAEPAVLIAGHISSI